MTTMNPWDAFDLTLEIYNIKAADISRASGISETTISTFRHGGRRMNVLGAMNLVKTMPIAAQLFYLSLCQSPEEVVAKFEQLVE